MSRKRTKTNDTPEYSTDDRVIIFGGVVDTSGLIESTIQTAKVVEVGENDLLVSTGKGFLSYSIVPKTLCIPLKANPENLMNTSPLKPQLGDMVYFRGKESWRDKEDTIVAGIVYEIAYAGGRPTFAKVYADEEMKELDYNLLLVLQRKSEKP